MYLDGRRRCAAHPRLSAHHDRFRWPAARRAPASAPGTFPRVLGHYAREVGLFTLEEAVRRMTSLPAARFGLRERGVLRAGAYADLVLFDPDTVGDRATFADPTLPAAGIEHVFVNGRAVWRAGATTGARPGARCACNSLRRWARRCRPNPLAASARRYQRWTVILMLGTICKKLHSSVEIRWRR
ncbi:MAG: amidohydrolase family protein [Gammaproteobacteria bacterium]